MNSPESIQKKTAVCNEREFNWGKRSLNDHIQAVYTVTCKMNNILNKMNITKYSYIDLH